MDDTVLVEIHRQACWMWMEGEEDGWWSTQEGPGMRRGQQRCEDFFDTVCVLSCMVGLILREMTYVAETGAIVTATESERHKRCEKLMCPTYSSWAKRNDVRFWKRGNMLVFFPLLLNYIPLICFWVWVSFCNLFSYMLNPHATDLFWCVFLTSLCVVSYQTSWSLLLLAY